MAAYSAGDDDEAFAGMLGLAEEVMQSCMRGYYRRRDCHVPYGASQLFFVTRCEEQDASDLKLILGAAATLRRAERFSDAAFLTDYAQKNYHCLVDEEPEWSNIDDLARRCSRRYDLMSVSERREAALPAAT